MSMERWKCGNKEIELKDGGVRIKMGGGGSYDPRQRLKGITP